MMEISVAQPLTCFHIIPRTHPTLNRKGMEDIMRTTDAELCFIGMEKCPNTADWKSQDL